MVDCQAWRPLSIDRLSCLNDSACVDLDSYLRFVPLDVPGVSTLCSSFISGDGTIMNCEN
jgi:hypothetical protein